MVAAWLAVGAVLSGGGCERSAREAPSTTPKTVSDYFPIQLGGRTVRLQLAVLPMEQQLGLMFRQDLGPDDGMLFVFPQEQAMSFWMRNTPTPLDIGYFDTAGVLREVYPMYPHDESQVRSHGDRLRFALEMHQGWYKANGIKPGAVLDRVALAAALRARGFDPRRFGLDEP